MTSKEVTLLHPLSRRRGRQEIVLGAPYVDEEGNHGVITNVGLNDEGEQTFTVSHRPQRTQQLPVVVNNHFHGDYTYLGEWKPTYRRPARPSFDYVSEGVSEGIGFWNILICTLGICLVFYVIRHLI